MFIEICNFMHSKFVMCIQVSIQVKGKRPAEPKSFPEFKALLDSVEGLKLDGEGNMALRYCGEELEFSN